MASYKYLDLSLSHITERDCQVLDYFEQHVTAGLDAGLRITKFQAGYFIRGSCFWLSPHTDEDGAVEKQIRKRLRQAGFSTEFCALILYAQTHDVPASHLRKRRT